MTAKPKILVVNDSVLVLSWVRFALRSEFDVLTQAEAIGTGAAILRLRPQLVLVDSEMPLLDGEDVINSIKGSAAGQGVGVVLFSALPVAELEAKANRCGADGYIQRTGDPAEFLRAVERFFSLPKKTVPAAPTTAVPSPDKQDPPMRRASTSRVVIADDHALRVDEREIFGPHATALEGVRSVSDLFTILRTTRPTLVVFGQDLADGTVVEACRFIRANPALRRVSVLFVGEAADAIRARAIEAAGANLCLLRPLEPGVLEGAVEKLLEVAQRRDARFLVRLRADASDRGAGIFAYSRDISVTGMRIETTDPIAVGRVLRLSFFMPDGRTQVACDGEIVRFHDRLGDRRSYGVKLVNLLPGFRQAIGRFVQQASPAALYC